MPVVRFSKAEVDSLLDAGHDAGSIYALEERGYGGRLQDVLHPEPENVRSRLLGMLPAAGATAGAVIGGGAGWLAVPGIGGVPGAIAGGAAGAMAGRGLEQMGREAMGMPRRQGMLERYIEGGGAEVPDFAGRVMDLGEQAGIGGLTEGAGSYVFGGPGRSSGALATGLHKQAVKAKTKTAEANIARRQAVRGAGRVPLATLEARGAAAGSSRTAAGQAKEDALSVVQGEVTVGEIVKRVRGALAAGPLKTAPDRGQLQKKVLARLESVLEQAGAGAINPRKKVFNIREADWAKTAFDRSARAAHTQTAKGVGHDPELDQMISNAWREAVEERVPGIGDINARYHAARQSDQAFRKRVMRERDPGFQQMRSMKDVAEDQAIREETMQPGKGGIFNPSVGMGGVWFHPPKLGALLERSSEFLQNPKVQGAGRFSPSLINLLLRAAEPEWNDEFNR
jgi:hypothetical protein